MDVLPDLDVTAMPEPVEAVQLLALMTRARQAQHDRTGRPAQHFVCHVGAFKTAFAELGYYRRLAEAGRHGGQFATSMPQLVVGLAPMHPRWNMAGDRFAVRDRHHTAVRHRLAQLAGMGLLRWGPGVDEAGEERRTEIALLSPPAVTVEELAAASAQLTVWEARYGPTLNTSSSTQVRDALVHGRPLSQSERQRRGVEHAKKGGSGRRLREQLSTSKSKTTPPSGALRNSPINRNHPDIRSVTDRTRVTRTRVTDRRNPPDAPEPLLRTETAASENKVREVRGGERPQDASVASAQLAWGSEAWQEALIARVAAAQTQRAPVIEMIARQAQARAIELADWGLERPWSRRRIAEAWVVSRYGASTAGDSGTNSAGPLNDEMYTKLRRSVARYERNATARPDGWPAGGLAALLHIATLAGDGLMHDPPRTLAYAIGRHYQIATRMRARRRVSDPERDERALLRATRRREPATALQRAGHRGFCFRLDTGGRWPAWILLPGATEPTFDNRGKLMLDAELVELYSPAPSSQTYRLVLRDAYHLARLTLPRGLDGPATMTDRANGYLPSGHRPEARSLEALELSELAHHTGQPIQLLKRCSTEHREEWLQQLRRDAASRMRRDTADFKTLLEQLRTPGLDGPPR
jgi:hypothetical protein